MASPFANILHAETVRRLAGDSTFARGRAYFEEGRVRGLVRDKGSIQARVAGASDYVVRIWARDEGLAYSCSCPQGQERAFCKHAVALALAWLDRTRDAGEASGASDGIFVGLDHVQVVAPPGCEEVARAFYGKLLGLAEIPKPPARTARGGVWFRCGAHELHVGVEERFVPAKKAHPALRVVGRAALDRLREHLAAHGVTVRVEPDSPATARFFADDPWGNRLELLYRE